MNMDLFHSECFVFLIFICVSKAFDNWFCFVKTDNKNLKKFYCKQTFESDNDSNCFDLRFSRIFNVPFTDFGVTHLKIEQCEVKKVLVSVKSYKQLSSLDISYSGYKSLDSFDLQHQNLEILNCTHNHLNQIPMRIFSKTPEITTIDFSYNHLEKIESSSFEAAKKLKSIYLSHNVIRIIEEVAFSNLSNLHYVDLDSNFIKRIESVFVNNQHLQTLRIKNNSFKSVPIIDSINVSSLHLSWDYFQFFDMKNLSRNVQVIFGDRKEGFFRTSTGIVEMHCNNGSLVNLLHFYVGSSTVENLYDLLLCLGSKLLTLDLSGAIIKQIDGNALRRFKNLEALFLSDAHLTDFDVNVIEFHTKLSWLDLSKNHLKTMKNVHILQNFTKLEIFDVLGNQLDNIPEILRYLKPSIDSIDLSENFVGPLNATTFAKFSALEGLFLKNTSLSFGHFNPFSSLDELIKLDLSGNHLENVNFTVLAETLSHISHFYAADCHIQNVSHLIQLFGSSLATLDLSKNIIGNASASLFNKLHLTQLNLAHSHLSHLSIVEGQTKLLNLNVSFNNLEKVNFSLLPKTMEKIYLEGNDLSEIDGLASKTRFPRINSLAMSLNLFSCEYLATFVPNLTREWTNLELIGDPWKQKHGEDCHLIVQSSTESTVTDTVTATEIPEIESSKLPQYLVTIGVSTLFIVVCFGLILGRRLWHRKNSEEPLKRNTGNRTEEPIEMADLSARNDISSETVTRPTLSEEHIYEEIPDRGDTYDHLRHEFNPMPISTNTHYDNQLLRKQPNHTHKFFEQFKKLVTLSVVFTAHCTKMSVKFFLFVCVIWQMESVYLNSIESCSYSNSSVVFLCSGASNDDCNFFNETDYSNCKTENGLNIGFERAKVEKVSFRDCKRKELPMNLFGVYRRIQTLNITKMSLEKLPDLDNVASLAQLYASHNSLSTIPKLPNDIRQIDLSNNVINACEFFENKEKVSTLNLAFNQISHRADCLSQISENLQFLNLSHNRIDKIPDNFFENASKLQEIDLSHNKLKMINVTQPNQVKSIRLNDNQIENLNNFEKFVNLEELFLSNNKLYVPKISQIFPGNSKLQRLNMANIGLKTLDKSFFENLTGLKFLDISQNKIETLSGDVFNGLSKLEYLDISQNKMLKTVNESMFKQLDKLKHVNLSRIELSEIPLRTFSSQCELESLDLSGNPIMTLNAKIFATEMNQLTTLVIKSCRMKKLEEFNRDSFPRLKIVGVDKTNEFTCKDLEMLSVRLDSDRCPIKYWTGDKITIWCLSATVIILVIIIIGGIVWYKLRQRRIDPCFNLSHDYRPNFSQNSRTATINKRHRPPRPPKTTIVTTQENNYEIPDSF
ncbi:uncharacterized protein LOC129568141 [Sitodiplosis mosellana]|uniref:uncharacterized protein LOC129568141 n=1 Tax=Sitodiplosis mosellana TaxID=263140 RepID=UPI0024444A10|nr:uncharacterized protein LOC129568141 [Sitodiplosis mosellana]